MAHEATFKLPLSVVSPVDLKRVKRELDTINDALLQTEIRHGGDSQDKLPTTSRFLSDIADANKLNLLHKEDREHLTSLVGKLVDEAPVMHMSFSAEPSGEFLAALLTWLRKEIDPYTLVTIGLAPSIGAGCIVRTTNHFFDLSLKEALVSKRGELLKELKSFQDPATKVASEPVAKSETAERKS